MEEVVFLIDTDTLIYALKGHPSVTANFSRHARDVKTISVISYGELVYGAWKSHAPESNLAKVRRMTELFSFAEVSQAVMETFGYLKARLEEQCNRLDDLDLIIAATSLSLNSCLVTNNEKHFKRVPGLRLVNWTRSF